MNLKTTKLIISGLLFIFALASCDKNEEINLNDQSPKADNNYLKFENNSQLLDYLQTFRSNKSINNTDIQKIRSKSSTIDIPKNKYPNVTGIEMFNPLSNTWLWLSGNKNNSLNTFDKTIIFRNINNQSIEYYRFTHRGSKIGSRKLRFTIS